MNFNKFAVSGILFLFLSLPYCLFGKILNPVNADSVKFTCNELLGRAETNSITLNMCADKDLDIYVEYGTQKLVYTGQTAVATFPANIPFNLVINNLLPNTVYYYRVRYRITKTGNYLARDEHYFKTAKSRGIPFNFAIEADPHLDTNTNPDLYKITLQNIYKSDPDFLLDLGDTFMSEKLQVKSQDSILMRHLLLRSFFDLVCHSIPLYLVLGNHEGELGWFLDGTANSLPVITSNTRTKYYPNPLPDDFYSGNTKAEAFVGLRQNYYAWEWGNALFVVIDPYWYTARKPNTVIDNWAWTLGQEQYQWLKKTLESSNAKFKLVFAHQLVGGNGSDGRGGSEFVSYYEMGGKNTDNTWGFLTNRQGWDLPIHQLMLKNKVNIFFHGHDHLYAQQEKDGIIYQEVPQPGSPQFNSLGPAAGYGYVTGKLISSSGFLNVTVMDSSLKVDYIRSYLPSAENAQRKNGMLEYSYTINNSAVVSVKETEINPESCMLMQNYPNPFNPETVIKYQISEMEKVQLKVYDILGREIAMLVNEYQQPGIYSVTFDANKYYVSSGVYFYHLEAGKYSKTMKMVLQK